MADVNAPIEVVLVDGVGHTRTIVVTRRMAEIAVPLPKPVSCERDRTDSLTFINGCIVRFVPTGEHDILGRPIYADSRSPLMPIRVLEPGPRDDIDDAYDRLCEEQAVKLNINLIFRAFGINIDEP